MIRLIGVITGSALAIGLLLLLLGVPEFGGEPPAADRPIADTATVEALPLPDAPQAPEPAAEAEASIVAVSEVVTEAEPVVEPQAVTAPEPVAAVAAAASPEPIVQEEIVDAWSAGQSEVARKTGMRSGARSGAGSLPTVLSRSYREQRASTIA